jgi:hypothetical protein
MLKNLQILRIHKLDNETCKTKRRVGPMSIDEAEAIESYYERSDAAQNKRSFLSRMEKKLRDKQLGRH